MTRRCQTRPTRIQPFCGRKGSASRASMLCVCSVAWRRGCVAWRVPRLLYFTLRCVCRAGRQGAGETGCRWRNRDYRNPLEVNPIKTVAGQPMWHCEHCGCAKSVCTADKRVWLYYALHARRFFWPFHQTRDGEPECYSRQAEFLFVWGVVCKGIIIRGSQEVQDSHCQRLRLTAMPRSADGLLKH
jgi:hypothetical protein